ncbi:MAG TPA: cytochrome c [Gemmatimonadales bacterium]
MRPLALMALLLSLGGCGHRVPAPVVAVPGGDPVRGRQVIERYGCTGCHVIPGVDGPSTTVGPPLAGMAQRVFIAGVAPNTPDVMVRWLRDPPSVDTLTAMPMLGLSDAEARDAAAFVYTLR